MAEPSGPPRPFPSTAPTYPPVGVTPASRVRGPLPNAATTAADKDWPGQAADLIVKTVDQVQSKTTGPILTAARGAVFGLVAVVLGTMAVVLLLIGIVRGLDVVIPSSVWSTYLVLGVLFSLVGTLLFRRRRTPGLPGSASR